MIVGLAFEGSGELLTMVNYKSLMNCTLAFAMTTSLTSELTKANSHALFISIVSTITIVQYFEISAPDHS